MHMNPSEEARIRAEFLRLTNLDATELTAWLETGESRRVGMIRRGETESVGRQSARRIIDILTKSAEALDDADYRHMRKVIAYRARHLAQRPWGDVANTRWRWSLMNWGHDPLRGPGSAGRNQPPPR